MQMHRRSYVQRVHPTCTRHEHGVSEHGIVHCWQVALARRQCWVRAFQLGPTLGLLSYSACVLVEAAGLTLTLTLALTLTRVPLP